ncbi:MAG: signal peptidase I [Anaerolineae bacterium]
MLYEPRHTTKNHKPFLWREVAEEWVKPMLKMLLVVLVINLFLPRYFVEGHSMEPSFHENDMLVTSAIDVMTDSLERGAVVVLSSPVDGTMVLKRIIGMPGDTVEIRGGTVYINGEALNEPYINERPTYSGEWVLGADEYFVLGDNRNHSYDSADYGPVPRDHIRGAVRLRYFPFTQLQYYTTP